ncbi:MAG TPA: hypothetical protein VMV91_06360 [Rhodocyclaceae bacterium]|nr:hypothetical protein [Rhodocyclaceae bacterium]
MKKELVIFWLAALAVFLGLSAALYPYAAVPAETLARSRLPQPMAGMADIDLPQPYGTVSVTDLVGYYLEHPPAANVGSAGGDGGGQHFGGC